ncbi:MAG: hypothetical protein ACP5OZ_04075 [Candidatus Woesearchaeota archaeon]
MKGLIFALIVIASFALGLIFGTIARVNSIQRENAVSWIDEIAGSNSKNHQENYYDRSNANSTNKEICELNKTCSEILSPVAINEKQETSNAKNEKENSRVSKGPIDRIKENQIQVFSDKIVIYLQNAEWASFTPTGSMEPVLNEYANAIQIVPKSEDEIYIGDIISYESEYAEGIIIHRVVEIGYDKEGWYCIAKGDNNPKKDPGKIRFSQIKRILVAIIY